MGDLIDRQNAIDVLELLADKMSDEGKTVMAQAVAVLKDLQSAEPEEEVFEWCHDCKEYDQEKHCCHRWTKVIRQTVEEIRSQRSERKKGEWTEYKKSFGVYGQIYYQHDCCPNLYESPYHFCPNCGAEME